MVTYSDKGATQSLWLAPGFLEGIPGFPGGRTERAQRTLSPFYTEGLTNPYVGDIEFLGCVELEQVDWISQVMGLGLNKLK